MFKVLISSAAYSFVFALAIYPLAARADSIPTITITSATGYASWGDFNNCPGNCALLLNPIFGISEMGLAPASNYQADTGYTFVSDFSLGAVIGGGGAPSEGLFLNGVVYPATGGVNVTAAPFIVPSGGTAQIPAVLTSDAIACEPNSPPNACIQVANVDVDIQGYLTFTFQPAPYGHGVLSYIATFTPAPEPSTDLLVFMALTMIAAWLRRNSLLRVQCAKQRDCKGFV
jgi:hypothetical protein